MRFVTLHGKDGRPIRLHLEHIDAIQQLPDGDVLVEMDDFRIRVSETFEEALRIVEDAKPDACAALVDAAKRLIDWMDTIAAPIADHNQAIKDIRAALAAMEVPHE